MLRIGVGVGVRVRCFVVTVRVRCFVVGVRVRIRVRVSNYWCPQWLTDATTAMSDRYFWVILDHF